MCGGGVVKELFTPVTDLALAAAAPFTGGASLDVLPLVNAAETKAQGGSWGQAALSGGEALAGQEALAGFGIGSGNSVFNDTLGITGDNPAGLGLPDIGKGISSFFGSSGATGTPTEGTATPGGGTLNQVGSSGSATGTGAAGPSAASSAAPSSVGGTSDLSQMFSDANAQYANTPTSGPTGPSLSLGTPEATPTSGGPVNLTQGGAVNPDYASGTSGGVNLSPSQLSSGSTSVGTDTLGKTGSISDLFTKADQSYLNTPTSGPSGAGSVAGVSSGGNSLSNFVSNPSISGFGKMLAANPSTAISALGLGADALKGNQLAKGERQLQNQAANFASGGSKLQGYLDSGTLPPGVQQSINQAAAARKAQITSQYAGMGMAGSSSMQQELQAVDAWAQGEGANVAMSLLQQGFAESGLSAQLYQDIANNARQQDAALGTALSNFASSFAGGTGAKA